MNDVTSTTTRDAVRYGAAYGMLLGSLCAVPDVILAAAIGHRVPLVLPLAALGAYPACGALGGALIGLLATVRSRRSGRTCHFPDTIPHAFRLACLAGVAAVFVERFRLGYEGYFDRQTGMVPVLAGLIVGVVAAWTGWGGRRRTGGDLAWQVLCAAGFCAVWQPVTRLYQAPTFSTTSLLANAALALAWGMLYFGGRPIARRLAPARSAGEPGRWARRASAVAVASLVLSCSLLQYRRPAPIDLPYTSAGVWHRFSTGEPQVTNLCHTSANVILIVIDTARADHLSAYGYPLDTTPVLRAFAEEAVRYDQAVAPSSWTLPSHASMFTGVLPTEHGAHNVRHHDGWTIQPLDDSIPTVAEAFSAAGYRTGAVVANTACLSREFGLARGFQYYDDRAGPSLAAAKLKTLSPALWLCRLYQRSVEPWKTDWSRHAGEINDDALKWVDHDQDAPFFLFINYLDPHAPYHAHRDFAGVTDLSPGLADATPSVTHPTNDMRYYDQEIAFTDAQIGRLFAALRSRGLYDESLIVVTSDHGEAFGEHGTTGHGHTLYQEEVRVPLLIRYPRVARRGIRVEPTALTAIPGILCDSVNIPFRRDHRPTPDALHAAICAELREVTPPFDSIGTVHVSRALYDGDGGKMIVSTRGHAEFYDLLVDGLERHDLSGQRVASVQKAYEIVETWGAQVAAAHRAGDASPLLSEALRDRLRSLGYLR